MNEGERQVRDRVRERRIDKGEGKGLRERSGVREKRKGYEIGEGEREMEVGKAKGEED